MSVRRKTVTTEELENQGPRPEDQIGETPGDISLWDYMKALPEEEWQRQTVYVYQTHPSVTRKDGEPAYLERFGAPFDEDVIRALAPMGSKFKAIVKRVGQVPLNFSFAMVPRHTAAAYAPPANPADKGNDMVTLLKEMIEKSNSGAGVDQLKESFSHIQEMMRSSYTESLKTIAQQKPEGEAGLIDKLVKLGVIKTGGQGGILETVGVLKQLGLIGEKREDVFDQIEKLKTMGELLGWSTGGHGGADDDWRISLAKNAPDILGGIERVTLNIVQAIQQARAPQGAPPPNAPGDAQKPALAAQQPEPIPASVMQAALDSLVKSKLIQFYKEEIEPEEVVAWLDLTAPEMVDYLKKFEPEQVHAFFKTDTILSQIASEEKCKPWIEKILAEMKAEPVEA